MNFRCARQPQISFHTNVSNVVAAEKQHQAAAKYVQPNAISGKPVDRRGPAFRKEAAKSAGELAVNCVSVSVQLLHRIWDVRHKHDNGIAAASEDPAAPVRQGHGEAEGGV